MHEHGEVADDNSKLAQLTEHLRSLRFNVKTGVLFEGQSFAIVARKGGFELLTRVERFFLVSYFESLNSAAMKAYSRKCFDYASRNRRVPLSVFCTVSYAVAAVHGVDDALASAVRRNEPIKHWSSAEFPVVWDLESGLLVYSEARVEFPDLRGLDWDMWRKTALEVLAPVA